MQEKSNTTFTIKEMLVKIRQGEVSAISDMINMVQSKYGDILHTLHPEETQAMGMETLLPLMIRELAATDITPNDVAIINYILLRFEDLNLIGNLQIKVTTFMSAAQSVLAMKQIAGMPIPTELSTPSEITAYLDNIPSDDSFSNWEQTYSTKINENLRAILAIPVQKFDAFSELFFKTVDQGLITYKLIEEYGIEMNAQIDPHIEKKFFEKYGAFATKLSDKLSQLIVTDNQSWDQISTFLTHVSQQMKSLETVPEQTEAIEQSLANKLELLTVIIEYKVFLEAKQQKYPNHQKLKIRHTAVEQMLTSLLTSNQSYNDCLANLKEPYDTLIAASPDTGEMGFLSIICWLIFNIMPSSVSRFNQFKGTLFAKIREPSSNEKENINPSSDMSNNQPF